MRTLVLNAGYEPLAVVSFKRALVLVMNEKATIVAADTEHPVWGSTGAWDRPSVIILRQYVRIPSGRHVRGFRIALAVRYQEAPWKHRVQASRASITRPVLIGKGRRSWSWIVCSASRPMQW